MKFILTNLAKMSMLSIGLFCLIPSLSASNNVQTTISTCAELQNIKNDLTGNYILTANISCNGVNFVPIGNPDAFFRGTLDGANYNIKDLSIQSSAPYLGLFGVTTSATIKNINFVNPQIVGSRYAGVLVGHAKLTRIENVQIQNGTVTVPRNSSSQYVGGMVGLLDSTSTMINSASSAKVQGGGNNDRDIGGLVGSINDSNIYSSHARGIVQGSGVAIGGFAGSLIGRSESNSRNHSIIEGCSATGAVTEIKGDFMTPSTRDMGGLIGYVNHSKIYTSYAAGAVTAGNGTYYIAGLTGELINDSVVQNSYASGAVSGSQYVGGLIGAASVSSVTQVYSAGHVNATTNVSVGGLIGYSYKPTAMNGYWDIQTSGQLTSAGGLGRSTVEMYHQAMYGWDFVKVWGIHEGEGYPFLLWQKIESEKKTSSHKA